MEDYFKLLDQNSADLSNKIQGIDHNQLTFKIQQKWNILEILEHIHLTDMAVYSLLNKSSESHHNSDYKLGKEKVAQFLANRNVSVEAPSYVQPIGKYSNTTEFLKPFKELRKLIVSDIKSRKIDLDQRLHSHFLLGPMTPKDWLYLIIHHTERHMMQIDEMLSNAGKPILNT